MKKIILTGLSIFALTSVTGASFLYQEIDPICSISGTTHTSFPGEISDTSSWNIPKAYDGKCDTISTLSISDQNKIYNIVMDYLDSEDYLESLSSGYSINMKGRQYLEGGFFPAVQDYIVSHREKKRNIAILNHAVSIIGYDYFIASNDYIGLTELEAIDLAKDNKVAFRIGKRDNEAYPVTMDYVVGRITATIENGIIIDYSVEK